MNMTDEDLPVKKIKLSDELEELSKEEIISRYQIQQEKYEELFHKNKAENEALEKLKNQVSESSKNENFLLLRLSGKEQEVQELMSQLQELKSQTPSTVQLKSMLLDSSVNLLFQHMKTELTLTKSKLEQAQKDLAAWKFSPDSLTGKRLMAKCSMLLQENEDLGRVVSSGRIAKLEGDIALQKKLISEMRKSEEETEKCLAELDETIESMQSTIFSLHTELNHVKQQLNRYIQECTCQCNTVATRCNQDDHQNSSQPLEAIPEHDDSNRDDSSKDVDNKIATEEN